MNTRANRRTFIIASGVAGLGLGARSARAEPAHVDDADEQAVALGYKHDTKQVDAKKYPKHEVTQHCGNCSFFQGKAGDAWAGCAMFGRKHIAAGGWCSAWAKAPNA